MQKIDLRILLSITFLVLSHKLFQQNSAGFTVTCKSHTTIVTSPTAVFPQIAGAKSRTLISVQSGATLIFSIPGHTNTTVLKTATLLTASDGCTITPTNNASLPLIAMPVSEKASKSKCLELDYCDRNCPTCFDMALSDLHLKKGDLVTVKIKNINPYTHDIQVTTKNDTLKTGEEPPLLAEFLDLGKLASIAGDIKAETADVTEEQLTNALPISSTTTFASSAFSIAISQFKNITKDSLVTPLETQTLTSLELFKKNPQYTLTAVSLLTASIEDKSDKQKIEDLTDDIENEYSLINECLQNSVFNIMNTQVECRDQLSVVCFSTSPCDCVPSMKQHIKAVLDAKKKLIPLLITASTETSTASELRDHYKELLTEIQSEKYYSSFMMKVQAKSYSNFLTAANIDRISNYYSFPLQVRGDEFEIKIDIIPKKSAKAEAKAEESEDPKEENMVRNVNKLDNNAPVTININTDGKKTESAATTTASAQEDGDGKDTKKDSQTRPDDRLSADEIKIVSMPAAPFETHLSYRYRINHSFYGFSTGLFLSDLTDDQYVARAEDPNNAASQYQIVSQPRADIFKSEVRGLNYGIMASVNAGGYFGYRTDWFWQVFTGPGVSIDNKLQPRAFFGLGFGKGGGNKFSMNFGVCVGQVKRLSNSLQTNFNYNTAPELSYYNLTIARPFCSILYVFDFRRAKAAKEEDKEKTEDSKATKE